MQNTKLDFTEDQAGTSATATSCSARLLLVTDRRPLRWLVGWLIGWLVGWLVG